MVVLTGRFEIDKDEKTNEIHRLGVEPELQ